MKKQLQFIMAAIAMILLLNSCSKEEQSQFSIDSIKEKATIQGTVVYNEGAKVQADNDIVILQNIVPAVGQTVLITVPYSTYGSENEGDKIFQTTVAEDGSYSIVIPIGLTTTNATITVKPFNANFYDVLNGNVETVVNALYNDVTGSTELTIALKDSDVKECDITVKTDATVESTDRTLEVDINGIINVLGEEVRAENNLVKAKEAISCTAIVTLSNPEDEDNREIQYVVKTGNSGEFMLNAAFYNGWDYDDVVVELKVETFYKSNTFKHYYREVDVVTYKSQYVDGLYSQTETVSIELEQILQEGELVPTIETTLDFTPLNLRDDIRGIGYSDVDYDEDDVQKYIDNDIMGWADGASTSPWE